MENPNCSLLSKLWLLFKFCKLPYKSNQNIDIFLLFIYATCRTALNSKFLTRQIINNYWTWIQFVGDDVCFMLMFSQMTFIDKRVVCWAPISEGKLQNILVKTSRHVSLTVAPKMVRKVVVQVLCWSYYLTSGIRGANWWTVTSQNIIFKNKKKY